MKFIKRGIIELLRSLGYDLVKRQRISSNTVVELSNDDNEVIKYVLDSNLTMTSVQRLVATLKSCKYVVENNIPGDFVECGVWRGGNGILAKKVFEYLGSDKQVFMFDTFSGMTEPTEFDVSARSKQHAKQNYLDRKRYSHNEWCYASIEDVKNNCRNAEVDMNGLHFVKGDVSQTLNVLDHLPKNISVLRLDTDFYESTKKELDVLYPKLSHRGVLLIDDYGHWEGSRKAVDE